MAPTSLFNKALDLMGYYEPKKRKREGSGARLNLYRLATPADVTSALAKLKAKDSVEPMALFRAELKAIRAQSRTSIDAAVGVWSALRGPMLTRSKSEARVQQLR